MSELAKIETRQEIARPNVGQLLEAIVKAGVTPESAAAVKELVMLQEHQQDRDARQQWIQAFMAAKTKCKTIRAESKVEIQGKVAWEYAKLPALLDAIEPICENHGLSISFDSSRDGAIVTGRCIVYHVAGHSESRSCSMTIANATGKLPDIGAVTTCQRKALMLMFGLKTEHMEDDDPRVLGDFITPDEAAEIETRCDALNRPDYRVRLLKYLHAEDFSQVYSSRLADARRSLEKAEANTGAVRPTAGAVNVTVLNNTAPANIAGAVSAPATGAGDATTPATVDVSLAAGEPLSGSVEPTPAASKNMASSVQGDVHAGVIGEPHADASNNMRDAVRESGGVTASANEFPQGQDVARLTGDVGYPASKMPAPVQNATASRSNSLPSPSPAQAPTPTPAPGGAKVSVKYMRQTMLGAKLSRGRNQSLVVEACGWAGFESVQTATDDQIVQAWQYMLERGFKI